MKNLIKNKKGGLAEIYVFAGVLVILIIIFIILFFVVQLKATDKNKNVDSKFERLDKELLLLNYLRTPYDDSKNFADYITMSNFYTETVPVDWNDFLSKTKSYFSRAMSYGTNSWGISIKLVSGRNIRDTYTMYGIKEISYDDVNWLKIKPDDLSWAKVINKGEIVATTAIPSTDGQVYLLQLYDVDIS